MIYLKFRFLLAVFSVLALTILPLPEFFNAFRPALVLLFVLYIQIFIPNCFSLLFIVLLGLSVDVLLATTLGEHAFALLLSSWLISGTARRFNFFPVSQQMLLIFILSLVYQLTLVTINFLQGFAFNPLIPPVCAVTSMMCWPFLHIWADRAHLHH